MPKPAISAAEAADKLEAVASKKAGLLGVSELSNDMRDLRDAIKAGNAKARLAVDKFTWTIAKWIGSYVAELDGLDMLVFTGGIGENDIASRAEICAGLGALGIILDPVRNNVRGEAVISAENSPVTVRVIPPAEDLMIVNHVVRLLASKSPIESTWMRIIARAAAARESSTAYPVWRTPGRRKQVCLLFASPVPRQSSRLDLVCSSDEARPRPEHAQFRARQTLPNA